MRITFILNHAGLSGGSRVIAIHADSLRRRGHAVTVLSTAPRVVPWHTRLKWKLRGKHWEPASADEPSFFDGTDLPHRVIKPWRPITADDAPEGDVVVATHWTTAEWVCDWPACKGAKAIFVQGYEVPPGEVNPRLDAVWRMPFHKIIISQWLVELARESFDDGDVSHVPNAVDTRLFHAGPRGKQHAPTAGLLYSTSPFKGCDVSLQALKRLGKSVPHVRLVAFGAERPTRRLPLPGGSEFHYRPAQESIRDIYAKCDVWLCGSNREGFHLPPLEAMACRCPVVSTRVGGPMDIVEEGRNGYMVPVGDAAALADRLTRVLSRDESAWRAMSDAALATAQAWTWDDATSRFEAALQYAIAKQDSARQLRRATTQDRIPVP